MITREGKIIAKIQLTESSEPYIKTEHEAENLLMAEQFLNNEVATEIAKRFNVHIRVHI